MTVENLPHGERQVHKYVVLEKMPERFCMAYAISLLVHQIYIERPLLVRGQVLEASITRRFEWRQGTMYESMIDPARHRDDKNLHMIKHSSSRY